MPFPQFQQMPPQVAPQIDPRTGLPIIQRPQNIGNPPGAPPLIGGSGLPPELMNPQPMAEQNIPMQPPGPASATPGMLGATPMGAMQSFGNPAQVPGGMPPPMLAAAASAGPGGAPQGMGGRIGDFLGSDAALALAAGILEGGTSGQALGRGFNYALQARQKPSAASTDDITEYAFAKSQGYQGSFTDYMTDMRKAGASSTSVDARQMGTIPPGYRAEYDEAGRVTQLVPIPGGPAAAEEAAAAAKIANREAQQTKYADVVTEDIDRAIGLIETANIPVTGLGSLASEIPGTPAHDVSQLIDTIKANAGFDRLQEMRDNSPTGGALGPVSDFENRLLQATIGNLALSQSQSQLVYNLRRVKVIYSKIINEGIRPGDSLEIGGSGNVTSTGVEWSFE